MVLTFLLLSACAPAPATSLPNAGATATPPQNEPGAGAPTPQAPAELPTGAQPAVQALSRELNIGVDAVRVISVEQVEWPDACLGVETPGTMCAQVITPGYRVILETQEQRYEYRTDLNGTVVKRAPEQILSDITLAWQREGGIAGFCDELTVYQTGDATAFSCKGGASQELAQARLEPADLQKLNDWVERLASFEYEQTDQAKADAMTVRIVFMGLGVEEASDADKQDMQAWAAEIFTKLATP